MTKTWLVMVQEIRANLRRKAFLFFGLGLPILIGVIALIVTIVNRDATSGAMDVSIAGEADRITEGLVDEGGLIEFLPANYSQEWLVEFEDEAAAQSALESGEIEAYYILPADYVQTGELTYVKPTHNPLSDHLQTENLEWVILANLLWR